MTMNRGFGFVMVMGLALALVCASGSTADVPEMISHQGLLTFPDGTVAPDGLYGIRFRICSLGTGENCAWEQTLTVELESGLYSVLLTGANLAEEFEEPVTYMEVEITSVPGAAGIDPNDLPLAMTPRQRISSVPYALQSGAGGTILLDYSATCDASVDGALRYDSGAKEIELCNGGAWQSQRLPQTQVDDWALSAIQDRGTGKQVYQRDDQNEVVQPYEIGRYHLSLTAANYDMSSKLIPHDVFTALCGDPDGCVVRLGMTRWNSPSQTETASIGSSLLYYSPGDGHWRMGGNHETEGGLNSWGVDNNGSTEHATRPWIMCHLTDGVFDSGTDQGDQGVGFSLLVWDGNGYFNDPARTCELTLID